jgi:hypothetical protein
MDLTAAVLAETRRQSSHEEKTGGSKVQAATSTGIIREIETRKKTFIVLRNSRHVFLGGI